MLEKNTLGKTLAAHNLVNIINNRCGRKGNICSTIESYKSIMSALNTIEYEKDIFLLSELIWKEWEKRVSELKEDKVVKTHIISILKAEKRNFIQKIKSTEQFSLRKQLIKEGKIHPEQKKLNKIRNI